MNNKDKAKQVDLYSLMGELGYKPTHENEVRAHYNSPLADESIASFILYKSTNTWYDWGRSVGGDTIAFIMEYKKCPFLDAIDYLLGGEIKPIKHKAPKANAEKIVGLDILDVREIKNEALRLYIQSRRIDVDLAKIYCREVDFSFRSTGHIVHTAIGFQNDKKGFELRNHKYKVCSAPKTWTSVIGTNGQGQCNLFEGYFDFLSDLMVHETERPMKDSFIFNGLAFSPFIKDIVNEKYDVACLYLDHGAAAEKAIDEYFSSDKFIDMRYTFEGYEDYNDYLINKKENYGRSL